MSRTVSAGTVSRLDFQYHMYGDTMGSATLEAYTGTIWVSAWTQSGNLGNAWRQASVTVAGGATMLRFKYTAGSSYTGDFALDDIQANGGGSGPSPAPSTAPVPAPGGGVLFVLCVCCLYVVVCCVCECVRARARVFVYDE